MRIESSQTYQIQITLDKKLSGDVSSFAKWASSGVIFSPSCYAVYNWTASRQAAHKGLKSPKRFTNLPWNHYIEWPVFSDVDLHWESQDEKGRTCRKYKILIGSWLFFFSYMISFFSPGHLLESRGRFVNLFGDFSPLSATTGQSGYDLLLHCIGT